MFIPRYKDMKHWNIKAQKQSTNVRTNKFQICSKREYVDK